MESTLANPTAASIILGVGVVVIRDGRIALGRRLSPRPCWSLPGGKIDPFETVEQCGLRELYEETGLRGEGEAEVLSVSNMRAPGLHTITFGVKFPECRGELSVREPDKFSAWDWFPLSELPEDLFLPARAVLDCFLKRPGSHWSPERTCYFSDVALAGAGGAP